MARTKIAPEQLHRRLKRLARQSNPVTLMGVMRHAGQAMSRDSKASFGEQKAPDITGPENVARLGGQAWPKLSPSTAYARTRRGKKRKRAKRRLGAAAAERQAARMTSAKRLLDTGLLRRSVSYSVGRVPGGILARVGTALPHGKYHQRGFYHRRGRRNIPAAPFLGIKRATLAGTRARILTAITKGRA